MKLLKTPELPMHSFFLHPETSGKSFETPRKKTELCQVLRTVPETDPWKSSYLTPKTKELTLYSRHITHTSGYIYIQFR